MTLQEKIETHFQNIYGSKRVAENVYHVSSIISDLDDVVEKHVAHANGGDLSQDFDNSSYYNFYMGELLEESTLPKALNDSHKVLGYKTQASFRHMIEFDEDGVPPAYLVGNADVQGVDANFEKFIVEQKTTNQWGFKKKRKQATDKHLKQLGSYIALSGAAYGYVWYVSKGNGNSAETFLHPKKFDDFEVFEEMGIQDAYDYQDRLISRVRKVHREVHDKI